MVSTERKSGDGRKEEERGKKRDILMTHSCSTTPYFGFLLPSGEKQFKNMVIISFLFFLPLFLPTNPCAHDAGDEQFAGLRIFRSYSSLVHLLLAQGADSIQQESEQAVRVRPLSGTCEHNPYIPVTQIVKGAMRSCVSCCLLFVQVCSNAFHCAPCLISYCL